MKKVFIAICGFGFGGVLVCRQIVFLLKFFGNQEIQEKIVSKASQFTSFGILLPAGIILVIYTYLLIKQ